MPFHITYLRRADQDRTEEIQRQYLRGNKIGIGQGTGCDIVIDDVRVAFLHATIEKADTGYLLKDVPGTNGTYVNGKVIQTHLLVTYDTIQIGSSVFLVCSSSPAEPLVLQIEHPQRGPLADAEAPVAYRKNLRLPSGFLTKWWLTILSLLAVMGITAIAWSFRTFLSPGPVSQAHSVMEHACAQCHRTTGQPVADTTCKTCHDGPQHHSNQAFTPSCVTCHTEHRGRQAALTVVEDRLCTQCHAALQARGVERNASRRVVGPDGLAIHSFTRGHPEFAVQVGSERVRLSDRAHLRDVAQVQLNHVMHLKPNKRGGPLKCSNCHQADAQRAYMLPVTYEKHCMKCHPLAFDERFPKQVVPHSTPEVVYAFLDATFIQYCRDHLLKQPRPRTPGSPVEAPRSIAQCAEEEVQGARDFLITGKQQQGCRLCHVVQPPATDSLVPRIVPTAIPQRWLPHSVFNHQAHARAGRSCEDCHRTARASEQTTDVLLPGVTLCQECHARASEVRSTCVTCHVYHDRGELERSLPRYMEDPFVSRDTQQRDLPTP